VEVLSISLEALLIDTTQHQYEMKFEMTLSFELLTPTFSLLGGCVLMKLIIQHGLLGAPRNWRSVVQKLGVSNVDVPWLRGHGSGPVVEQGRLSLPVLADDLAALLRRQTEPFVLMGSSVGGLTIMQYLVEHECSPLLRGAIVVDVAPVLIRPATMPDLDKELRAILRLPLHQQLSHREANALLESSIPNVEQRGFLLSCVDLSSSRFLTDVSAIHANLSSLTWTDERVYDGELPLQFVFGQHSPYNCDLASQSAVQRVFPRAKTVVIPNAGHWVHVEQKDVFVDAVKQFLSRLSLN